MQQSIPDCSFQVAGWVAQVPDYGTVAARAGVAAVYLTLLPAATRRETPGFRHWRKCRQPSLEKGWRKRYLWIRSLVAYPKARIIGGVRYKQTEPSPGNADV